MVFGRLVRVGGRGDPSAVSYVVAIESAEGAIAAVRRLGVDRGQEIEDLGPVKDSLLEKLNLRAGEILKLSGAAFEF
jgi:hypothetical protein